MNQQTEHEISLMTMSQTGRMASHVAHCRRAGQTLWGVDSGVVSRVLTVNLLLAAVLLALQPGQAAAQTVYRIVGADGKVTFSDKPPVATADKVTATGRGGKPLELGAAPLPFELRQVVSRYPVTLYTSTNCAPCGTGRAFLGGRGVPFVERTVNTNEDVEALGRISGESSLPFLTIGGQKIKGFSDSEWTQFLDAAGYPAKSVLPSNYRSSPAAPLVAIQRPEPAPLPIIRRPAAEAAEGPAPEPVNTGSNPTGIRF